MEMYVIMLLFSVGSCGTNFITTKGSACINGKYDKMNTAVNEDTMVIRISDFTQSFNN